MLRHFFIFLMDGSVACAARCLASSAFRRQAPLSDDIRGGSSNAPNREEKPRRSGAKGICGRRVFGLPQRDNSERGAGSKKKAPPDDGAKDVMHGATQGSLNPSPTVHIRVPTRPNWGNITLSGMTRFAQIAVVPSPARLPSALTAGRGA